LFCGKLIRHALAGVRPGHWQVGDLSLVLECVLRMGAGLPTRRFYYGPKLVSKMPVSIGQCKRFAAKAEIESTRVSKEQTTLLHREVWSV